TFLIWFNQGDEIRKTLKDLTFTGLFGALLAGAALFGFLRRHSMTMIAVACIPFSLIVACGIIWALGKTMNTLTLLGLIVGIGMLVDNAVVVMENVYRHQEEGLNRLQAARVGSREVSTAVIAATLTSVIVFLPMIFNKPTEMNIRLRERAVTLVENLIVPHRDELNAEHVYSYWSGHFSLTRLYMKEGFANDDAMAETRRKLRGLLPELPGIRLEVQDQSGHGWRHRGGKRIGFQIVG
ncbi:MAG: efflux RND transporter permease subunit, partial [bacterium]|nr:efflux RND transporter permease subunit [bacterium]